MEKQQIESYGKESKKYGFVYLSGCVILLIAYIIFLFLPCFRVIGFSGDISFSLMDGLRISYSKPGELFDTLSPISGNYLCVIIIFVFIEMIITFVKITKGNKFETEMIDDIIGSYKREKKCFLKFGERTIFLFVFILVLEMFVFRIGNGRDNYEEFIYRLENGDVFLHLVNSLAIWGYFAIALLIASIIIFIFAKRILKHLNKNIIYNEFYNEENGTGSCCKYCNGKINIEKGRCRRCKRIVNEKAYQRYMNDTEAKIADNRQVKEKSKANRALRFFCFCIPFLGVILWLIYRKKDKDLAEICLNSWANGHPKIMFIMSLLILAVFVFVIDLIGSILF